jgi:hypothetical protein
VYENISIDWTTAEVTVEQDKLRLSVLLKDAPDSTWANAFGALAERRDREVRGDGWHVSWPSGPHSDQITVTGVSPGTEPAVREAPDTLVAHASENARRDVERATDQDAQAKEAAARRERDAEEMTKRFRSDS